MINQIIQALCINCGEVCGYGEIICAACVSELPMFDKRCTSCGYALSVEADYCKHCEDKKNGIDFYYSDYQYTDAIKDMLYSIKFQWRLRGVGQLVRLCVARGVELSGYDRVIPIPYHFLRRFSRYHQPVDMIMHGILRINPSAKQDRSMCRTRNTVYQARLSRKERVLNVKNVFAVDKDFGGEKILIVDDILTTGATLKEAAKVLKKHGAETVDVYTFAAGVPR